MTKPTSKPLNKIEQQGVFLFRFGEKDHLEMMRETGAIRWSCPVSLGEPERPVPDPIVLDKSEGKTLQSEFIFCVAGFLGQKFDHLRNSDVWPPLARLVSIMLNEEREIVRPYLMPILDSGRFLGAMYHGFICSLCQLQRSEIESWGTYSSEYYRFLCGLVHYGETPQDSPDLRFVGQEEDRDECEFRFLGQSDITFTWDSIVQNWYPVCVPSALLQDITDPPVPTEQLLDPVWRRNLVDRVNINCHDWIKYKFDIDFLNPNNNVYAAIDQLPNSMRSPRSPIENPQGGG